MQPAITPESGLALSFVDTHVHLWNRRNTHLRYAWMEPGYVSPAAGDTDIIASPTYDFAAYRAESRFAGVDKIVHIQAALGSADPVMETAWIDREAAAAGVEIAQVVGASLRDTDLEQTLDRHLKYRHVVGVRDSLHGDGLDDRALDRGLRALASRNLSLDVGCTHQHMDGLAKLANRNPGTRFVLVHAGLPMARDDDYFAAWTAAMRHLAQTDNITCKISGLGLWDPLWTVASLRPWILGCIDAFGTDRCIFGSNWPIDRKYSSFDALLSAYRRCVADLSSAEQAALFTGNAETMYRLTELGG